MTSYDAMAGLKRIAYRIRREQEEAIRNGEISGSEATRNFRHDVLVRAAGEFKWHYRRIKL